MFSKERMSEENPSPVNTNISAATNHAIMLFHFQNTLQLGHGLSIKILLHVKSSNNNTLGKLTTG